MDDSRASKTRSHRSVYHIMQLSEESKARKLFLLASPPPLQSAFVSHPGEVVTIWCDCNRSESPRFSKSLEWHCISSSPPPVPRRVAAVAFLKVGLLLILDFLHDSGYLPFVLYLGMTTRLLAWCGINDAYRFDDCLEIGIADSGSYVWAYRLLMQHAETFFDPVSVSGFWRTIVALIRRIAQLDISSGIEGCEIENDGGSQQSWGWAVDVIKTNARFRAVR